MAVCQTLTVLKPAEITILDFSLNPTNIEVGGTVTATIRFSNSGDVQGTADFRVFRQDNDQTLASGSVTVPANSSVEKNVSFNAPGTSGSYNICAEIVSNVRARIDTGSATAEDRSLGIIEINGKTMVWV